MKIAILLASVSSLSVYTVMVAFINTLKEDDATLPLVSTLFNEERKGLLNTGTNIEISSTDDRERVPSSWLLGSTKSGLQGRSKNRSTRWFNYRNEGHMSKNRPINTKRESNRSERSITKLSECGRKALYRLWNDVSPSIDRGKGYKAIKLLCY